MVTRRRLPAASELRPTVRIAAQLLGVLLTVSSAHAQSQWSGFAENAQHTAIAGAPTLPLRQIIWQTPVDLAPQYQSNDLLIHYGSPLVNAANTLIVPVKYASAEGFRVEARSGATGGLLWQLTSDYTLPEHQWIPSFSPVLTPSGRMYMPGVGGTLVYTDHIDRPGSHATTRVAFYGLSNYNGDMADFNADVRICTGLTSDAQGTIYFGFRAAGANPLAMLGGVASVDSNGVGSFVTASAASGGVDGMVAMNCAPALSNDEQTLYIAMQHSGALGGDLIALSTQTLSPVARALLLDPQTGMPARVDDNGTSSPMVAPDGRVYFGVVGRPQTANGDRGWLLQFDSALNLLQPPGSFGWDDTPSLMPASAVPSYTGASPYLLMTKYNNYAGAGSNPVGDGVNKLAILDPNDTQINFRTGTPVMKEVLTIAGVTPDSAILVPYPNAVREWCINSALVDPFEHSVLAGSEDGKLYRWDLTTNTFSESIVLTPGIGEAYTPTMMGPDGKVYAINNATLFAVGVAPGLDVPDGESREPLPRLAPARPTPFREATMLRFSLPVAARVVLDIVDVSGSRVRRLMDADVSAGDHSAMWDGCDGAGLHRANGVYFARLAAGRFTAIRKLILTR